MNGFDDPSDDMFRFPSSAEADRLLSGRVALDDLPGVAAPLAQLLEALEPRATSDPVAEQRVVASMTAEILRTAAPEAMPSLLRASGTRVPAKAGALAFAAVLVTGTAAAAANGSLPAGMQRAVSDALSHVSISVPSPAPHPSHPVESHNGGTDGPRTGGSPGGATGTVGPRGVEPGKDDEQTPRGSTKTTPGAVKPGDPGNSGATGNNGNHNGPPSTVPNGPKNEKPGNGQHNGADNGKKNGADKGNKNGADKGKKKGQTEPAPVTTTTVVKGNGKGKANGKVKDESNAGGNGNQTGNAGSHASPKVSGSDPKGRS